MNSLMIPVGMAAVLGSALVGGVFFAFSSFVMKALARVPSAQGIGAMQSINIAVINPSFLGVFIGTALLSIGVIVLALMNRGHPSTMFFVGGAVFYVVGTFLVTVFGNVPLNDQLAAVSATDADAVGLWTYYLERWTLWNHVRTAAAAIAVALFCAGLVRVGINPML